MESTAQTCAKCGTDVAAIKRFKDGRGRLFCEPCAAALRAKAAPKPATTAPSTTQQPAFDDDGTFKLADEPAPPLAPRAARQGSAGLEICPDCGLPLPSSTDICKSCGFNKKTGFAIGKGQTDDALVPTAHTPKPCKKCGYDLTGLKTARCPECGTINVRMKRARDPETVTLLQMFVKPFILAAIGVTLSCLAFGFIGMRAAGVGAGFEAVLAYLAFYAISVPVGFVAYLICSIAFIGFDEPIGVTFVRIAAVFALTDVVGAILQPLPVIGWVSWAVQGTVYVGLLMHIMELDYEDAWLVALVSYLVHIAAYFTVAYVWGVLF